MLKAKGRLDVETKPSKIQIAHSTIFALQNKTASGERTKRKEKERKGKESKLRNECSPDRHVSHKGTQTNLRAVEQLEELCCIDKLSAFHVTQLLMALAQETHRVFQP